MLSPEAPSRELSIAVLGVMRFRALINKFSSVELGKLPRKAFLAGPPSARSS